MQTVFRVWRAYLDLSLHRDTEERDEVHDQDRPEDGYVEDLEGSEAEGDGGRLHDAVPELELWQPALKRPELVRRAGRQGRTVLCRSPRAGASVNRWSRESWSRHQLNSWCRRICQIPIFICLSMLVTVHEL